MFADICARVDLRVAAALAIWMAYVGGRLFLVWAMLWGSPRLLLGAFLIQFNWMIRKDEDEKRRLKMMRGEPL